MSFQVRRFLVRAALIACSGAALAAQSAAAPAAGESRLQQQDGAAIRSLLVAAVQATAERGNAYRLRELAERFYAESGFVPAWFEGTTPRKQALQVLELLQGAASHGLDPADYDAARLAERLRGAGGRRGVALAPADVASIDVALSLSLFRWLSDMHVGRVSPRELRVLIDLPQDRLDLVKAVREAIAADRLPELAAMAAPRLRTYDRLREALARYRQLAAELAANPLPAVRKLEPGMPYAGLAALHRLLVALGDLPASAPLPSGYEGELVDAVRRFQARHGLEADGVIGRKSFEQLDAPLAQRVRQIELALERLRWLPPLRSEKAVVINIPEFRLRALEVRDGAAAVRLGMNIIVGRALATQTPMFIGSMRYVEFSPYWNVPASIARKEIIPKLRRDPAYLAREEMEFVGAGGDGGVTTEVSEENLEALARGELRVRQRPGPRNALGGIKFVLPNDMDVYLHHTPSVRLFAQSRRDFSHGCIRVEAPVELAKFVLAGQQEWNEERILAAMAAGTPSTARLARPLPVVVFYTTALVEDDGRVFFLPDIYGHDRVLERALRER
jgi:murein L,D-transpeptidase YcbB/YkuD